MADTLLGGIVINEILVDPNGANNFDTDGSGTAGHTDEYVELYNSSGAAIDISGLELWDAGVGEWFTFPPGTVLAAGAHAMVMSGVQAGGSLPTSANPDDLFFDAGRASPLINNVGDNVVLYDPANDEYIQARFNGDALDDPPNDYAGFSATATRSGTGEDFGNDIDGYSIQRDGDGNDTFINDQTPTPGDTNVCFTKGTLLATPTGARPIERLSCGDELLTKDNGAQKIIWIWARRIKAENITTNPKLGAVRINKGALGSNLPNKDTDISRQHRILVRSKIANRMFGKPEVLLAAKDLLGQDGINPAPLNKDVIYYHILMQDHEILFANGAATESLFLGPESQKAIEPAAKQELEMIFGKGWDDIMAQPARPAREIAKGKKARNLCMRHLKNRKMLQAQMTQVSI